MIRIRQFDHFNLRDSNCDNKISPDFSSAIRSREKDGKESIMTGLQEDEVEDMISVCATLVTAICNVAVLESEVATTALAVAHIVDEIILSAMEARDTGGMVFIVDEIVLSGLTARDTIGVALVEDKAGDAALAAPDTGEVPFVEDKSGDKTLNADLTGAAAGQVEVDAEAVLQDWIPFGRFLLDMYKSEFGFPQEVSTPLAEGNVRTIAAEKLSVQQVGQILESIPAEAREDQLRTIMELNNPTLLKECRFMPKALCRFFANRHLKTLTDSAPRSRPSDNVRKNDFGRSDMRSCGQRGVPARPELRYHNEGRRNGQREQTGNTAFEGPGRRGVRDWTNSRQINKGAPESSSRSNYRRGGEEGALSDEDLDSEEVRRIGQINGRSLFLNFSNQRVPGDDEMFKMNRKIVCIVRGKKDGQCWVIFQTKNDKDAAAEELHGIRVSGGSQVSIMNHFTYVPVHVDQVGKTRDGLCLAVHGLPKGATAALLQLLFTTSWRINLAQRGGTAFVKYNDEATAKDAFLRAKYLEVLGFPVDVCFCHAMTGPITSSAFSSSNASNSFLKRREETKVRHDSKDESTPNLYERKSRHELPRRRSRDRNNADNGNCKEFESRAKTSRSNSSNSYHSYTKARDELPKEKGHVVRRDRDNSTLGGFSGDDNIPKAYKLNISHPDDNFLKMRDYFVGSCIKEGMERTDAESDGGIIIKHLRSVTHFDELEEGYIRRFLEKDGNLEGYKFSIVQSLKSELRGQDAQEVARLICAFFKQNDDTQLKLLADLRTSLRAVDERSSKRVNSVSTEVTNEWRRRKRRDIAAETVSKKDACAAPSPKPRKKEKVHKRKADESPEVLTLSPEGSSKRPSSSASTTKVTNELRRRKRRDVTPETMFEKDISNNSTSTPKSRKKEKIQTRKKRKVDNSLDVLSLSPIVKRKKARKISSDYDRDDSDGKVTETAPPKAKNHKPAVKVNPPPPQASSSASATPEYYDLMVFLHHKVITSREGVSKDVGREIVVEVIKTLLETCGLNFLSLQRLYVKNVASIDRPGERVETGFLTDLALMFLDKEVTWSHSSVKSSYVVFWIAAFFSQDLKTKKKIEKWIESQKLLLQLMQQAEEEEKSSGQASSAIGKASLTFGKASSAIGKAFSTIRKAKPNPSRSKQRNDSIDLITLD